MNEIEDLKAQLSELRSKHEGLLSHVEDLRRQQATSDVRLFGAIDALVFLTMELAGQVGVAGEQFLSHYPALFRYCLDKRMGQMENENPAKAAETDTRQAIDFDFPDSVPRLFEDH